MADNFRTYGRDAPARDASSSGRVADPLAELARLIGQSAPRPGQAAAPADAHRYEDALPQVEWAAGEDADAQSDHAARDAHSARGPAWSQQADERDPGYDDPPARHYADADGAFDDDRDYSERRPPAFGAEPRRYAPPAHEDDYPDDDLPRDDRRHYAAPALYQDDRAHDHAHDDDEHDGREPRRGGAVLIFAVLGLAVLGSAAAFGYRGMAGRSVVSGTPPIIKPAEGPVKVQPSQDAQAGKPGQAEPAAKIGERLVEHQEQPVDVQSANPPVPRMVQTIPVMSNASAGPIPGAPSPDLNAAAPMPPAAQQPMALPPAVANPPAGALPQAQAPGPVAPGARQVHTVIIRPGQQGTPNPDQAAAPPAAAQHGVRAHEPVQRPRQSATAGGPLSIVPGPEGESQVRQPARTHVALRAPEATSALGGYAVQVTSQRSEAEAEAAYRALQAKYPQQLGGHAPLVRRADLGAKGIYYRALVGPFGSGEQATELCSKLKAAGGSCIVQKN